MKIYTSLFIYLASKTLSLDVPAGYKESMNALLSITLEPNDYNKLVRHGCWCVNFRLNSGSKFGTGGKNVIDEIDAICKQWFFSRKCLRTTGQACYDVININNNGYTISNEDVCVDSEDCSHDTCEVDKYFVSTLAAKIETLNLHEVKAGECPVNPIPHELVCGGSIPSFDVPKVLAVAGIDKFREEFKLDVTKPKFTINTAWDGPLPETGNLNDLLGAKKADETVHIGAVNPPLSKRRKRAVFPQLFNLNQHQYCGQQIAVVRQQGSAQTAWAFTAAQVAADTICMANKGANFNFLSPQYLASCCNHCRGPTVTSGGWAFKALNEFIYKGIPTGSDLSNELFPGYGAGCYPYALGGMARTIYDDESQDGICHEKCSDNSDLNLFGKSKEGSIKRVYINDENISVRRKKVKYHLMNHGPMIMWMNIYSDFFLYSKGTYDKHEIETNKYMDNQFFKVIGWGQDDKGKDYWLCTNTFGKDWAAANGKIRIKMGAANSDLEGFHGLMYNCQGDEFISESGKCSTEPKCQGEDMLITKYETPNGNLADYIRSGVCKAHHSDKPMVLKFINNAAFSIRLWWPNYSSVKEDFGVVLSGHFSAYHIFTHHAWIIQKESGDDKEYLGIFVSPPETPNFSFYTVTITEAGRLQLQQESCNRIINTKEIGEVNMNGLFSTKFCKSLTSTKKLDLIFVNNLNHNIIAYWLSPTGDQSTLKLVIKPGKSLTYKSFAGHAWVIRANDGEIITLFGTPVDYSESSYELKFI